MSHEKDHFTTKAKAKVRMTKKQDSNYAIKMNSKLCYEVITVGFSFLLIINN